MLKSRTQRHGVTILTVMSVLVALTGCATSDEATTPGSSIAPAFSAPTSEPSDPASDDAAASGETPEESFRAWLAASRAPDAPAACGYLSDALIEKMLAEMHAGGWSVVDCAEMITTTAELYAAVGESAEVEIETRAHTDAAAELFVAYVDGDCGRVIMEPAAGRWVMTENTEEEC